MEKEKEGGSLKDEAQHLLEAIKAGDVVGLEHSLKDFIKKLDEQEYADEGEVESGTEDVMAAGKKAVPAEQAMRMGR